MDVATVQKRFKSSTDGARRPTGALQISTNHRERFITEQATLPIDEIGRSLRGFADREFTVPAP